MLFVKCKMFDIMNISFENECLALMGAASPDLEKQGFLAVVFVYREYSGQQEFAS